ncbi:molybdopterin molybdotransferase MoeA [Demequina muriae]|uniref:Molybdopterin molybdenumtransferase n=1 Tax=Demequina muriae TaxID=3051664 RepID=A0ABT8GJ01_9MICO|nr:gephyrin-like molybdotransferase Glp [Demequina sp. EGI L300058]MDN4481402.1 molybdopterin molybdotransferase MoeA [Demequina sp. EGI L300058]
MRDLDAHVARALALVAPLAAERLALGGALGLTAARDHAARDASPPFDNSAMDGYAVRSADVQGATPASPVVLPVAGETAAGAPPGVVPAGHAWRIMTGAPMPDGADAVVPVESTDGGVTDVTMTASVGEGRHVRRAGEDARPGDVIVHAGQCFTAVRAGALAAVGVATVDAVRAPRVAVIATGDELVDVGEDLAPGQIHDSNSVLLAGLLRQAGADPVVIAKVSDRPEELLARIAAVDADLIVTTGGVSVGAYDVVKEALAARGVEFVRVAMQPGKPQGLGLVNGTPTVCLPGNPVSVLVSFATIVAPMLRRLGGDSGGGGIVDSRAHEAAVVDEGWSVPPGRRQFMPVRFTAAGTVVPATPGGSGSHLIAGLAAAEALADVPAGAERVAPGDTVNLVRWSR